MKIVATSDLHGNLPDISECDLLIIGGDVCPVQSHDRKFQADWLRGTFSEWLDAQPATLKVWVGGNHDFVLEDWREKPQQIAKVSGLYLYNTWIELYPAMMYMDWPEEKSLKIWGSPMSNRFGSWAFMASEDQLSDLYKTIPRDVDIIVTHGPPYGVGDLIPAFSWSAIKHGWDNLDDGGEHVGSRSLFNQLKFDEWPNLKAVFTGHIHEAYGHHKIGNIDVYNTAHMDGSYQPNNPVMEIDL